MEDFRFDLASIEISRMSTGDIVRHASSHWRLGHARLAEKVLEIGLVHNPNSAYIINALVSYTLLRAQSSAFPLEMMYDLMDCAQLLSMATRAYKCGKHREKISRHEGRSLVLAERLFFIVKDHEHVLRGEKDFNELLNTVSKLLPHNPRDFKRAPRFETLSE